MMLRGTNASIDQLQDAMMRQPTDDQFNSFLGSWFVDELGELKNESLNVPIGYGVQDQDYLIAAQPFAAQGLGLGNPYESPFTSENDRRPSGSSTVPTTSSGDRNAFGGILTTDPGAPSPPAMLGRDVEEKPTLSKPGGKNPKVLEKNRRAQARFRDKKKQKERDMEAQVKQLQQQLQTMQMETTSCKRQNEVLTKVLELRQTHIDVLTETAKLPADAAIATPPPLCPLIASSQNPLPKPTVEQCKVMTAKDATIRWRDYVQRMATLLVAVETPNPSREDVDRLQALAQEGGSFLHIMAVVNPNNSKGMSRLNLDSLQPVDPKELSDEAFQQQFWRSKVDSLMLTAEQKEKVLFIMQRHQETLVRLDREVQPYHKELEILLPDTIGIEKRAGMQSCVRSSELIALITKNLHSKHEAWFVFSATVLGKLLTTMQFARYCFNAYPYFPTAKAITAAVISPNFKPVTIPLSTGPTLPVLSA